MTALFVSLWAPAAFTAIMIPAAVYEGYGVYCLFAFIVNHVGKGQGMIEVYRKSENVVSCFAYQRQNPERAYNRTWWSLWQFTYIRPLIVTIIAIGYYGNKKAVVIVFTALGAISTVIMVVPLFSLAYTAYDYLEGLSPLLKLLMVKVSVGLILIEGAAAGILAQSNKAHLDDDSGDDKYTDTERVIRVYCVISLVEAVLLCIPMWFGFSKKIVVKGAESSSSTTPSLCTVFVDVSNVFKYTCSSSLVIENSDLKADLNSA
jgi:hypothetical protein